VAAKRAKTAQKTNAEKQQECPRCGSDVRVVRYAGFGPRGLFWVCEKNDCEFMERTR